MHGGWHKRCTGPAHEEPVFLPATEKYFFIRKSEGRKGQLLSRCRLCTAWARVKSPGSNHGLVPLDSALPIYQEAVNRVGLAELSRRTDITKDAILDVLRGRYKNVRKATLRKITLELISMRRKGEYSISQQAKWRRDQRNFNGSPRCVGCGGYSTNMTTDCNTCYERFYNRYRRNQITREEWDNLRNLAGIRREELDADRAVGL
jgi:hypothetical protein